MYLSESCTLHITWGDKLAALALRCTERVCSMKDNHKAVPANVSYVASGAVKAVPANVSYVASEAVKAVPANVS